MKTRTCKKSSFITGISHKNRTLAVSMVSGKVYYYADVPEDVAVRFTEAKSYGKFYNQHISGQYEMVQVAEINKTA
jgi:hypothetical protein